jgi:hypothetical protein
MTTARESVDKNGEAYDTGRRVGFGVSALALGLVTFLSLLGAEKAILAIVLGALAVRGGSRSPLSNSGTRFHSTPVLSRPSPDRPSVLRGRSRRTSDVPTIASANAVNSSKQVDLFMSWISWRCRRSLSSHFLAASSRSPRSCRKLWPPLRQGPLTTTSALKRTGQRPSVCLDRCDCQPLPIGGRRPAVLARTSGARSIVNRALPVLSCGALQRYDGQVPSFTLEGNFTRQGQN